MGLKIRLARAGTKKRPFYRIVVADVRAPRDGRFIEKIGTYNPLLPRDAEARVTLDAERAKYWLSKGALPTDRVLRFLDADGLMKREARNNPVKGLPGKKRQEREEEEKAAAEEAKAAAEAPAEQAPAPEAKTEEAPAPEAKAEEAPAPEAKAEEAPAEEAPADEAEAPAEAATEAEAPAGEEAESEAKAG